MTTPETPATLIRKRLAGFSLLAVVLMVTLSQLYSCGSSGDETADTLYTASLPDELPPIDRVQLLGDIEFLASDALQGRFPGTEGSRLAQEHIIARFTALGVEPVGDSFRHHFSHTNPRNQTSFEDAVNIIGMIPGTENPERFIAVTAHYDHLGMHDGQIFNGADDNASGVGGLLAAARHFTENPPQHSLLLLALDVEEQGLGGAQYFVQNPAVPLEQIVMNLNMDMISHNFENRLVAAGTFHYPFLRPFIEEAVAFSPLEIIYGFDNPDAPQDWTFSSDHGPFHASGIPFIYFGVEDHDHYHQPTDTFDRINPDFYVIAVSTIISVLEHLDRNLAQIEALHGAAALD